MTATDFTIADPNDPRTLDVAGFDADTPSVISGFSRGDFG
jgi:60 kDa SS-A/Ro ribonucleoprotein